MTPRMRWTLSALVALALLLPSARRTEGKTTITNEPDCKIKITLNLEFHGAGADSATIAGWKSAIVSKWSGLKDKSGWCDVIIEVNTKIRASGGSATAGYDQIEVIAGQPKHTSWCKGEGIGTDRTGEWDDADTPSVAAHESGHLMGLDNGCEEGYQITKSGSDQSKRKATVKKGREGSIMSGASCTKNGIQWDMNKILQKAGVSCPDSCCEGKGVSTTDGGGTAETPAPGGKPNEPGEATFTDDGFSIPHSKTITLPDNLGGATFNVPDFTGVLQVAWGPALDPEVDLLADPEWVPIAVTSMNYSAPPFLLPTGDLTGPNQVTLNPDPRLATTGRLYWATGEFELSLATLTVNDLFPPSSPLSSLGVVTGNYNPSTGQFQYQTMSWPFLGGDQTGIEEFFGLEGQPKLRLLPAAPNPTAQKVAFAFSLPKAGEAVLAVYDVAGRRVRTLESGVLAAGPHVKVWDLRDDGGKSVVSGVYLYRLEFEDSTISKKVTVRR